MDNGIVLTASGTGTLELHVAPVAAPPSPPTAFARGVALRYMTGPQAGQWYPQILTQEMGEALARNFCSSGRQVRIYDVITNLDRGTVQVVPRPIGKVVSPDTPAEGWSVLTCWAENGHKFSRYVADNEADARNYTETEPLVQGCYRELFCDGESQGIVAGADELEADQ